MTKALDSYEQAFLPNGTRVVCSLQTSLPFEQLDFVLHAGANTDGVRPGIHHRVEHLLTENVPGIPADHIEGYIERLGGSACLGEVDFPYTRLSCKLPLDAKTIGKVSEIFGTALFRATFEQAVEREESAIIEEFHENYPEPEVFKMLQQSRRQLFGSHPLAYYTDPLGHPDSIRCISLDQMQAHHKRHFIPPLTTIVATGGMAVAEIKRLLEQSPCGLVPPAYPELPKLPAVSAELPKPSQAQVEVPAHTAGFGSSLHQGHFKTWILLPAKTHRGLIAILEDILRKHLYQELREKHGWLYQSRIAAEYLQVAWVLSIECNLKATSWPQGVTAIEDSFKKLAEARQMFYDIRRHQIKRLELVGPEQAHTEISDTLATFGTLENVSQQRRQLEKLRFQELLDLLPALSPKHRFTVHRAPLRC